MLERLQRGIVVGLCTYEVTAILSGRVPTITALNRRHPVVGRTIVAALAWHFHTESSRG